MSQRNKKAFTLIELLIVIAIIGILSSVVLVKLVGARERARDAARLKSIKSIQSALEVYYAANGHYPIPNGLCGSTVPNSAWCNSVQSQDSNGRWIKENGTGVLSAGNEPIDPKQGATASWLPMNGGTYFYFSSNGQWYMLVFGLENLSNPIQNQDGVTACGTPCSGTNYCHYGNGSNGIVTVGGNCVN